MKHVYLALIPMFLGSVASADFSGYWTGKGTLKDPQAASYECKEVTFEVKQTAKRLRLKYGYLNCDKYEYTYPYRSFSIHGNHLVLNGVTVGTFTGDSAKIAFVDSSGMRVYVTFELSGTTAHYSESLIDFNGNESWALEGDLEKQN